MTTRGTAGADEAKADPIIPGAFERHAVPHERAGAMGGPAYGSDDQPVGPGSMDADTIAEREKEGGGGQAGRRDRRAPAPGR